LKAGRGRRLGLRQAKQTALRQPKHMMSGMPQMPCLDRRRFLRDDLSLTCHRCPLAEDGCADMPLNDRPPIVCRMRPARPAKARRIRSAQPRKENGGAASVLPALRPKAFA